MLHVHFDLHSHSMSSDGLYCNSRSFAQKGLWDWQKINQALNRDNKCVYIYNIIYIGILYSLATHLQLKVESGKKLHLGSRLPCGIVAGCWKQ